MRKTVKIILIIINLLAAISLIVGCYGAYINNGDYWFTGLFTLTCFYLLLINLAFIIFWLFAKFSLLSISLLSIILCWFPLQHVFQFRMEPNFNYEKKSTSLRVMSWNVEMFHIKKHKKNPEIQYKMFQLINEMEPDVACFQEMAAADSLYKRVINYIPYFSKKMKMPYYHYSYIPHLDFDRFHHFGKVIFSRYPIIAQKTIYPEPNVYNSAFHYVDIVKGKDTIRVFNFHLQSMRFSPKNKEFLYSDNFEDKNNLEETRNIVGKLKRAFMKRHWQSDQIRRYIEKSPYPVVVCGDFNDVPNSYAYNTIGKGLNNAFREKGYGLCNSFSNISPTLRIDNIFVDQRFVVQQFVRIKKKLSDHYPIVTDLELESNSDK